MIHWDKDFAYCGFLPEDSALSTGPKMHSIESLHVHCGLSFCEETESDEQEQMIQRAELKAYYQVRAMEISKKGIWAFFSENTWTWDKD